MLGDFGLLNSVWLLLHFGAHPAPLKLRPYGAIQICLLLLLLTCCLHNHFKQTKISKSSAGRSLVDWIRPFCCEKVIYTYASLTKQYNLVLV